MKYMKKISTKSRLNQVRERVKINFNFFVQDYDFRFGNKAEIRDG